MQNQIEAWIETELHLKLLEPLQVLQESDVSSWFEGRTENVMLFVKISPRTALLEGRIGKVLSRFVHGLTPDVLGFNSDLGVVVTRKLEAWDLSLEFDTNLWLEAVGLLVKLQCSSLTWTSEFQIPTLDLPALLESCRALMNNVQELENLGLSPEYITKIQELESRLSPTLEIFQASGLPDTLIHGDFHANNVLIQNHKPKIIDWSEAALASPLLDLGRFLEFLRRSNMNSHPAREIENALTTAFFEPWQFQVARDSFFAAARVAPFIATLVFATRAWGRETHNQPFMVAYHLKRAVKMLPFMPTPTPLLD